MLTGNSEVTDSKGNAYFADFKIERGPEAYYTFQFTASKNGYDVIVSEEFSVYVSSNIYQLESLNTFPLLSEFNISKPLKVQPIVKVKDIQGNPISGKRIVAFSWVDAYFSDSLGYRNSPSNLKFMVLENFISEPSNSEGIARFTNLTINGGIEILAYIHFYAEGVTTVWTDRVVSSSYNGILPPRAFYPLIQTNNEYQISILTDIERTVVEGNALDLPLTIQVHDLATAEPLKGLICFANLQKDRGFIIPNGYRVSYPDHPLKYLERPIPGNYSEDFDNPASQDQLIKQYAVTDSEGKVTFKDLKFSKSGPAGNYSIFFSCGLQTKEMIHNILVFSSIDPKKIKFRTQLPEQVFVKDLSKFEYDLVLIIEVLDKNDMPIKGKYPSHIYVQSNLTKDSSNIEGRIQHEIDLFEASQDDGIMTIPIKISKLTSTTIANVTLTLDSMNITTGYIKFLKSPIISKTEISQIKLTNVPVAQFEAGLEIGETFLLEAEAFNAEGDPVNIEDKTILLQVYFNLDSQAPVPAEIVKLDSERDIKKKGNKVSFRN